MTEFSHIADEYDIISRDYQMSKQLPFRLLVEQYSTFSLLPDLAGRSVVDLACGEGIYARKLKRRGASRVVGVDISAEMVALARQAETADPIGVEYLQSDVSIVGTEEHFDVAFCSYLFNYARSRDELRSLIESVARLLRPGGLVVGCNDYPDNPPTHYERYRPYGFIKIAVLEPAEGSTIRYRFFNPDGSVFELDNYFLPTDMYKQEFEAAGFKAFDWVMPQVSPEGRAMFESGFWDDFLESPPIATFSAFFSSEGTDHKKLVDERRASSPKPR
jgi:toxoflavin synthase